MIELAHPAAPDLAAAGRALVERRIADPGRRPRLPESPAAPAGDWVEALAAAFPGPVAWALVEHLCGVLPLAGAFLAPAAELADLAAGSRLGALGLFTPAPEPGWEAAAVDGAAHGGALALDGEVRLASAEADGALVLVRLAGAEHRLAWVSCGGPGVERRRAHSASPAIAGGGPGRLILAGAVVEPASVSRPVDLAADGELGCALDEYAGIWALAAALAAGQAVRALRRAARTAVHRGRPFGAAQELAVALAELEIEAELALAAARGRLALAAGDPARPRGLATALGAARALDAAGATAADLAARLDLPPGGPLADAAAARALLAFSGAAPLFESELGRALGIPEAPPDAHPDAAPEAER